MEAADALIKEVEQYCFLNDLDSDTKNELMFIVQGLGLYLKANNDGLRAVKEYHSQLLELQKGKLGTCFNTEAINLYWKLPTVLLLLKGAGPDVSVKEKAGVVRDDLVYYRHEPAYDDPCGGPVIRSHC